MSRPHPIRILAIDDSAIGRQVIARDRARRLGADEYPTKPIQTKRVLSVAKSRLEA